MQRVKLDSIDRRILRDLQQDGRVTNVELAERAGISAPPCLRRVRALEGEGYIHGKKMKKMSNNIFWLRKGEYTTCNADHPHFSIKSNKIKIVPNKQIVTGPAYVTFFNVPTPLFLPFGYFPNSKKKSSGIILPSYGESANLGFFL